MQGPERLPPDGAPKVAGLATPCYRSFGLMRCPMAPQDNMMAR